MDQRRIDNFFKKKNKKRKLHLVGVCCGKEHIPRECQLEFMIGIMGWAGRKNVGGMHISDLLEMEAEKQWRSKKAVCFRAEDKNGY